MDSSQPEAIVEVSEPPSPEDPQLQEIESTPIDEERRPHGHREVSEIGLPSIAGIPGDDDDWDEPSERTSLLPKRQRSSGFRPSFKDSGEAESQVGGVRGVIQRTTGHVEAFWRTATSPKTWSPKSIGKAAWSSTAAVVGTLPAVFLGWLLNVLDALSYGTILFPLGEKIFEDTGPDGIAIFFVSTVIAQVIYSCLSKFKGGVGSEMIEVVPFFHKMCYLIMAHMGSDAATDAIMATVYVSYCISAIVTGIIFLLLGVFRLGNLVSFFPRSILTGCIGGVGVFLFITGIEVSAGMKGNLEYNLDTLQQLLSIDTLPLWTVPLLLAIILFVVKLFFEHPAIVPAYFVGIMAVFYIVVAAVPNLNLEDLRNLGWVFEKPQSGVAFYHFYSYYSKYT